MTMTEKNATYLVDALARVANERRVRVMRMRVGEWEVELEMATTREEGPPDLDELNAKPTELERIVRKLGSRGDVNTDGDDE